ncbi:MAG: LptA/OstA family protein [Acidobacteriota bacterium]
MKPLRKIRIGLILLIVGLLIAVAVSYFSKHPIIPGTAKPGEMVGAGVTRLTRGFEHTDYRKGVPQFKLSAGVSEERLDRILLGEGVTLQRYTDGKPSESVQSRQARYDVASKNAEFLDQVVLHLFPGVDVLAGRLLADMGSEVATISSPFEIRGSEVHGRGEHLTYDIRARKLEILKGLSIESVAARAGQEALHLEARHATYLEDESTVLLEGNAQIWKGQDRLKAPLIRMWLTRPPGRTLERVEAEQGARLERVGHGEPSALEGDRIVFLFDKGKAQRVDSFSGRAPARWSQAGGQSLQADLITGHLDDQQRLAKVDARKLVVLERTGSSEETHVYADEMDGWMDLQTNQLQRAELRGRVRLEGKRTGSGYRAAAPQANVTFARGRIESIVTTGASSGTIQDSQRGDRNVSAARRMKLKYDATGQFIESIEGEGSAVVENAGGPSAKVRTLRAEQLWAEVRADGTIESFRGNGAVQVDYASPAGKQQTSRSDRISGQFENRDVARRIEQSGNFRYVDDSLEVRGQNAVYEGAEDRVTVTSQQGLPELRQQGNRTTARVVRYWPGTQQAHLDGGVRTEYVQAASSPQSEKTTVEPLLIAAPELKVDVRKQEAVYLGGVQAVQGENSTSARTVRLFQKDERMVAEQDVQSVFFRVNRRSEKQRAQIQADRLEYFQRENRAVYEGRVRLRTDEALLQSERLVAFLQQGQKLERAVSETNVRISAPGRNASGDRAEYFSAEEKIILTGKSALVSDDKRGTTRGRRLTFSLRDDTLIVDGNH